MNSIFQEARNPFNIFISQEFGSLRCKDFWTALQRVVRLSDVATRRFREETFPSSLCLEKSRHLQDRYVHDWTEVYSRRKSQLCNSCKRASRNSLSIEIFLSLSVVVCATLNAISQLKRHIWCRLSCGDSCTLPKFQPLGTRGIKRSWYFVIDFFFFFSLFLSVFSKHRKKKCKYNENLSHKIFFRLQKFQISKCISNEIFKIIFYLFPSMLFILKFSSLVKKI